MFLGVDVLCLVCSKPFLVKTFHLILVCYFRVYHCLVQGLLRLLGFSFYYNLLVLLSIVLPSVFRVPLMHFPLSTTSSATSSFVASGCSDGQFSVFGVM